MKPYPIYMNENLMENLEPIHEPPHPLKDLILDDSKSLDENW